MKGRPWSILLPALSLLLVLAARGWCAFATLYVSPSGSDSNPGSLASPYRTVQKAFDRAKTMTSSMSGDIVIMLRAGYYPLSQPITLDDSYSGKNGYFIILQPYGSEKPVIGGGVPVTDWLGEGGGIYKAYIGPGLRIRQLYNHGQRMQRARSGDITEPKAFWLDASEEFFNFSPLGEFATFPSWTNLTQIEVVAKNDWRCFRGEVASLSGNHLYMKQPFWSHATSVSILNSTRIKDPAWIENAKELLDRPGEWYYDPSTGYVFIKTLTQQEIPPSEMYRGVAEKLLYGKGRAGFPLHHIKISGITFAHTGWTSPSSDSGFVTIQVTHLGTDGFSMKYMPSALSMEYTDNVSVQDNLFIHLGGDAINFGTGVKNSRILGNKISDVSGSGIILGEVKASNFPGQDEKVSNNLIQENYIVKVGQEFLSGNGIFMGYVENTVVEKNELYDLPSTGISLGWGWGEDNYSNSNLIRSNRIGLFGHTLNDNGGIYVLGKQRQCRVTENYVYKQRSRYGGIYLDNGATDVLVDRNVVDSSGMGGRWIYIQFNGLHATGNTIRDNYYQWPDWRQCSNEPTPLNSACEENLIENNGGYSKNQYPSDVNPIIAASGIQSVGIREKEFQKVDFPVSANTLTQVILNLTGGL